MQYQNNVGGSYHLTQLIGDSCLPQSPPTSLSFIIYSAWVASRQLWLNTIVSGFMKQSPPLTLAKASQEPGGFRATVALIQTRPVLQYQPTNHRKKPTSTVTSYGDSEYVLASTSRTAGNVYPLEQINTH